MQAGYGRYALHPAMGPLLKETHLFQPIAGVLPTPLLRARAKGIVHSSNSAQAGTPILISGAIY